jgi:hypothetical protein
MGGGGEMQTLYAFHKNTPKHVPLGPDQGILAYKHQHTRTSVPKTPGERRGHDVGTSNDTEIEKLKKRLQFVVNCFDCFVS